MKKSIQLVALLLTVVMGSCTGGKDKAATEHVVEKPKVKVADVKASPVTSTLVLARCRRLLGLPKSQWMRRL